MTWVADLERLIRNQWVSGDQFTIAQVYELSPHLEKLHPAARNLEARVRDALQGLRERRIVEFVNKGVYRLL